MDHQLQARSPQAIEDALLDVDDVLRIGVVEYDADQEGPPERESACLRIG
jgi:hypothetical protein